MADGAVEQTTAIIRHLEHGATRYTLRKHRALAFYNLGIDVFGTLDANLGAIVELICGIIVGLVAGALAIRRGW